jgi:hypothetical protein
MPIIWRRSRTHTRYSDGSIICGRRSIPLTTLKPQRIPQSCSRSPSSEGDDDGDKRSDFQSLTSLEAYVLVAQDQRRVKVYRRAGREWRTATYHAGDSFELPMLSMSIAVADIYDGILDAAGKSLLRRE